MELTRTFTAEQYADALESWTFVNLSGKTPFLASPFGDVFLRADDGVWVVDLLEGTLTRIADTPEHLQTLISTEDGQDEYLLAGLAIAAEDRGIVPGSNEIYSFVIPPVLGGSTKADNINVIDFVVGVNVAGQVHAQTRHLPPGAEIAGVSVADESDTKTKKGWFRRK